MRHEDLDQAETRYVRARVLDALRREGFRAVMEGLVAQDGWRAEFIGHEQGSDIVLMAHKPYDAPYLGLSISLDLQGFDRSADLEQVLEIASDHDLSPFFPAPDRDLLHLSTRLPISGVNDADLRFWIGNLGACRFALAERFGADAG